MKPRQYRQIDITADSAYEAAVVLLRQGWGLGELQALCVKAGIELTPDALNSIWQAQKQVRALPKHRVVGW